MIHEDEEIGTRYFQATSALQHGDLRLARREFECLTMDAPRFAPGWDGLGRCHDADGDPHRAGQCYRRAIRLDRGNWRSRYNWGRSLHRAGDLRGAARLLREALRLAPTERLLHHALGHCRMDEGNPTEAARCFRAALAQPERELRDAELHLLVATAEAERGDLPAAEKECGLAALLAPDDPGVYYHWAAISARNGDLSGADSLAARAAALDPRSRRPHLLRASLAMERRDWAAAEMRVRTLDALPDAARLAQALRAEIALHSGDALAARDLALQALTMTGALCDDATDRALTVLREVRGRRARCRGFRLVVEAYCDDQSYFRPYLVLAEDEPEARELVAELQDTLESSPWRVAEAENFQCEAEENGEALTGVYQVLLTRVLFPRAASAQAVAP
jgi:Flp pilus assembly protein TadD